MRNSGRTQKKEREHERRGKTEEEGRYGRVEEQIRSDSKKEG